MVGGAALGRDRGVDAVVLDPHDRVLAELAALVTDRGDHHDRPLRVAAQDVGALAAGGLVRLDLVAHPLGRAGLVLALQGHASRNPIAGPAHSLASLELDPQVVGGVEPVAGRGRRVAVVPVRGLELARGRVAGDVAPAVEEAGAPVRQLVGDEVLVEVRLHLDAAALLRVVAVERVVGVDHPVDLLILPFSLIRSSRKLPYTGEKGSSLGLVEERDEEPQPLLSCAGP